MISHILVISLRCLEQDGNETAKVETCDADTKYCVFKQMGDDVKSTEKDCADDDDRDLKDFYDLKDTGCIKCTSQLNCKKLLDNGPGDLKANEMVCFCKTDECNQCRYTGSGCKKIEKEFAGVPHEMEICDETCGPKFASVAHFTAESKFVIASSTTLPMWILIL